MADFKSVFEKVYKQKKSIQSFLKTTRPLIFLIRTMGMIPIIVQKSDLGEYEVKLSNLAWAYCIVGTAILYAVPVVLCFTVVDEFDPNFLTKSYTFGRNFFAALMNTVCLSKCNAIYVGLRKTADLGLVIPAEMLWTTFAIPLGGHASTIAASWKNYRPTNRHNGIFMILTTTSFLDIVCVFALFSLQVAILRKALAKINKRLSSLLESPWSCKRATLRSVMCEHQKLHDISLHLNEGFGVAMTIALAVVLLKAIYCIALLYKTPEYSARIFSVIFGFWHGVPPVIAMHICQTVQSEIYWTTVSAISFAVIQTTIRRMMDTMVH